MFPIYSEFTANVLFILDLHVTIKGIDQEIDGTIQIKRGTKSGLRKKALSLVCSKDKKEQGCLQNFHTVKLGEWQGRIRELILSCVCVASTLFVTQITCPFRVVRRLEITEGAKFHPSHLLALLMMER